MDEQDSDYPEQVCDACSIPIDEDDMFVDARDSSQFCSQECMDGFVDE